jgi:hypothetical protein
LSQATNADAAKASIIVKEIFEKKFFILNKI